MTGAEQELNQNLDHLKAFIDEEILLILGKDEHFFPFSPVNPLVQCARHMYSIYFSHKGYNHFGSFSLIFT